MLIVGCFFAADRKEKICLWHHFLTHIFSKGVKACAGAHKHQLLSMCAVAVYILQLSGHYRLSISAAVIDKCCGFWGESYSRKPPRLSSITHIMEMSDIHSVHMLLYRVSKIFNRPGSLCVARFCILVFLCFCSPWSLVVLPSVFVVEEL